MSDSIVEIAHRRARKRAIIFFLATVTFVLAQTLNHPFGQPAGEVQSTTTRLWVIQAILLLACLGTGGGLLTNRKIRALVNDEVSRMNYQKSVTAGFWVAMSTAIALYYVSGVQSIDARQTVYLIVSISLTVALFVFSWLEYRATSDA